MPTRCSGSASQFDRKQSVQLAQWTSTRVRTAAVVVVIALAASLSIRFAKESGSCENGRVLP
jgi:hypothetical protein